MQETKESGNLLNLVCIQLREKKEAADEGRNTGKEEKEMEEGGDLLNLVLKWKQKQVLESIGATGGIGNTGATGVTGAGASPMQVIIIQASAHKGF